MSNHTYAWRGAIRAACGMTRRLAATGGLAAAFVLGGAAAAGAQSSAPSCEDVAKIAQELVDFKGSADELSALRGRWTAASRSYLARLTSATAQEPADTFGKCLTTAVDVVADGVAVVPDRRCQVLTCEYKANGAIERYNVAGPNALGICSNYQVHTGSLTTTLKQRAVHLADSCKSGG